MYAKTLFLTCFSVVAFLTGAAQAIEPTTDLVGWYFDETASQRCIEANAYESVTAYLCIKNPSASMCKAWELKTTLSGNCAVTNWNFRGNALDIGLGDELVIAYGDSCPLISIDGVIVICEATVFLIDDQPVEMRVEPIAEPTVSDEMIYLDGSQDRGSIVMKSASGENALPNAWINSDTWPCGTSQLSREHEVFVKTMPGVVQITNPSGGDRVGNVGISVAYLDSLVADYQVQDIRRVKGAFPDTVKYQVRVTDEEKTSYLFKNCFVFSLGDSTRCSDFVDALLHSPGIAWAELPVQLQWQYLPSDPEFGYHIRIDEDTDGLVDVQSAWDIQQTSNQEVTIIDSGIDFEHREFNGIVSGEYGYYEDAIFPWHGTAVAGLVGAIWNNDYGTAGMNQCSLWNKKIADDEGAERLAQALHDVMDNSESIVANFSASFDGSSQIALTACAEFYNSNRILVSAAGTNGTGSVVHPARYTSTIAVSGINSDYQIAFYHLGEEIDFTAPGMAVYSTTTRDDTDGDEWNCKNVDGTSFAAPIVAGAAAILLSYNPNLYNDDVYNLLRISATYDELDDPQPYTYSEAFGHGLIKAGAAVDSLIMNALVSSTACGSDRTSVVDMGNSYVVGHPSIPVYELYHIKRIRCEKDVLFPVPFTQVPHAWGRGVDSSGLGLNQSTGYHFVNRKHHAEVLPGSVTTSGCTLVSYTYTFERVWPTGGTEFYYPTLPSQMLWGYAALGKDGIVATPEQNGLSTSIEISPNPFNAQANLSLYAPNAGSADVSVYDIRGRRIKSIFHGRVESGWQTFAWDGKDSDGRNCSSAIYCIRAEVNSETVTKSFTLIK